jgi:hypothetical protein
MASHQSGIIVLVDRNLQQLVNTWVAFQHPIGSACPKTHGAGARNWQA